MLMVTRGVHLNPKFLNKYLRKEQFSFHSLKKKKKKRPLQCRERHPKVQELLDSSSSTEFPEEGEGGDTGEASHGDQVAGWIGGVLSSLLLTNEVSRHHGTTGLLRVHFFIY